MLCGYICHYVTSCDTYKVELCNTITSTLYHNIIVGIDNLSIVGIDYHWFL